MPRDLVRDLFRANARMLVMSDGDHVKCATVNQTPVYDRESGTVTVRGKGIRLFAEQRMTFGVANYGDGDLPIVNRSYSGAVPNEKITWGKLGQKTPKFIVESDATIMAPLIFSWVLGK